MLIALAGNPNSGKTTLYNALTGAHQTVGNWPGVTVERKEAQVWLSGATATLVDLPGVYALDPYAIEERIAQTFLRDAKPDVVVNIVDATRLERSLYLTTQLLDTGLPVIVALNMMDEAEAQGITIAPNRLASALKAPVVPICARKKQGLDELRRAIEIAAGTQRTQPTPAKNAPDTAARARYALIERVLARAGHTQAASTADRTAAIDRAVLNRVLAYPILLGIMASILWLTFGPLGASLSAAMGAGISVLARGLGECLRDSPTWLLALVTDGILAGVGGVVTFLPQILLLFLFLSLLEDTGYMARAAFLTDRLLRAIGLSGRACVPLILGLGCTTTAVVAARAVDSERERKRAILLAPFISCGGRLPVYALMTGALFPSTGALVVGSLYMLGICMLIVCGCAMNRGAYRASDASFFLEMPPYRPPSMENVLKRMTDRARDFLLRAGTILFVMSVIVWFLQSFSPRLTYVEDSAASVFAALGSLVAPLFRPLGFGDWRQSVAILSGVVAKEAVVSTMQVLYGAANAGQLARTIADRFTPLTGYAFLVFVLLYTPCVSAIAAIRRETGSTKLTVLSIALQWTVAYVCAFVVYRAGLLIGLA